MNKKFYLLYGAITGGAVFIVLYLILQILLNTIEMCIGCFALLSLITFPCNIFDVIGTICFIIAFSSYIILGALIGAIGYYSKLKK